MLNGVHRLKARLGLLRASILLNASSRFRVLRYGRPRRREAQVALEVVLGHLEVRVVASILGVVEDVLRVPGRLAARLEDEALPYAELRLGDSDEAGVEGELWRSRIVRQLAASTTPRRRPGPRTRRSLTRWFLGFETAAAKLQKDRCSARAGRFLASLRYR